MKSRKKIIRFSQKQNESDKADNRQDRLSFFNKLTQPLPAKVGGAAISALIVLHFISQFVIFQNERVQDEVAMPKIESRQIAEVKPEYEPVKPDIVKTPDNGDSPAIAQPERKSSPLPKKTIRKKQPRESKSERPRRAERTERVFHSEEVASVFPYGRFLTR